MVGDAYNKPEQFELELVDRFPQAIDEPAAISLVTKDLLARLATSHRVIGGTGCAGPTAFARWFWPAACSRRIHGRWWVWFEKRYCRMDLLQTDLDERLTSALRMQ